MASVHVPRRPAGSGGGGPRPGPPVGARRTHSPIRSRGGSSARTGTRSARKDSTQEEIEYMAKQSELFTRRIEVERRRAAELDKKLKISRVKLEESRRAIAGQDDVVDARHRKHKFKTVQNKVDHMLKRLNEQRAKNEGLKRKIEALRRDKMHMNEVAQKLRAEIDSQLMEEADDKKELRKCAERRDAAEREIKLLQSTITTELAAFEQEFKARVEEGTAVPTRSLAEIQQDAAAASSPTARFGSPREGEEGAMSFDQELELRHRSTRSFWDIARREVELAQQGRELQRFEDAFAQIQEETGIRTIDEMVTEFVSSEDQNFSLITMINELNQEIEAMEVENAELKAKVKAKQEGTGQQEGKRQGLYSELQASVEVNQDKATQYDRQQEMCLRYIDVMKPGIHSLFQKVSAGDDAMVESLNSTGVSDGNIMEFLGFIEQRVTQICQLYEMSLRGESLPIGEGGAIGDSDSPSKHHPATARGGALSTAALAAPVQSRVGGSGAPRRTNATGVLIAPVVPTTLGAGDDDDALSVGGGVRGDSSVEVPYYPGGSSDVGSGSSFITESTAAVYRRAGLPVPVSVQGLEAQMSGGVLSKSGTVSGTMSASASRSLISSSHK